jgi:hypothetical protein
LALLGLGLAAVSACTLNPPSGNAASAPRVQVTQVPKTPNAPGNAVWVLTPLGVNVRSGPDVNASRLATVAQAARLDISEPQLPATPSQPGQELRQEGPLELYGKSVFVTIYKLNGGGYEFTTKTKCKAAAYLVDYRQGDRSQPDTTLYKSLLSSMIAPDCAPGA